MKMIKVLLLLALVGTCTRVMADAMVDTLMGVIKTEVVDKYSDYIKSMEGDTDPATLEPKMQLATDEVGCVLNSLKAYKEFTSVALRGIFVELAADIKTSEADADNTVVSLEGDGAAVAGNATGKPTWARALGFLYYNRQYTNGAKFAQADKDAAKKFIEDGFIPVQTVALRTALFTNFLANPAVSFAQIDDVLKQTQADLDSITNHVQKVMESKKDSKDAKTVKQVELLKKSHEQLTDQKAGKKVHHAKGAKTKKETAKKKK